MPPASKEAPFDAHHSPVLGDVRAAATMLAVLAGSTFVVSGVGYIAGQDWWAVLALAGACASVVLMLLTFTPWWLLGLGINVAIAILSVRAIAR